MTLKSSLHTDNRSTPVVLDTRVVKGSGGGPDKTILNSPRYLETDGYRMICAYMHDPDDAGFERLRQKAAAKNAPLFSVMDRGPFDWTVIPQMLELCEREKVDIWHGHDYKTNALGLILRKFRPMKLVTTVHGWVEFTKRTPLYYWIDRTCLRYYEKVICVSDDLYRKARASGVPGNRCELIENGIDLDDYRRKLPVSEAKQRLGLDPHRLLIGAVGRLSPEKGFHHLIRAVSRLQQKNIPVSLVILGEGTQQAELENLIAQQPHSEHLQLAGYCGDLPKWYEAMDCYALSSDREGLPNVLLEAMAMEVPVVATRVNGIPRLIENGQNGLLVSPGDPELLAQAMERLLNDEELRNRLMKAGRQTIEKRYSFRVRMDRIRGIYDTMLGR